MQLKLAQRSKTPSQTQDKDHDGGPILALSGLSRARHDGLYRTLGTLTTSTQRRIGSGKLSGQGTERYYFSGIARTTRKKPESYLVWYRDSNSGF